MVALRSKQIDGIIGNSTRSMENMFYEQQEYRAPIEAFSKQLESLIHHNVRLETYCGQIQTGIDKVANVATLVNNIEEVDSLVNLLGW